MNLKYIILFLLVGSLIVTSCKKDENIDPQYPTIVKELSEVELNTRLDQLAQTDFSECTALDYFGIPMFNVNDSVVEAKKWRYKTTKENLTLLAKEAIADYGFFLNNTDSSSISIKKVTDIDGVYYSKFFELYPDSLPTLWCVTTNPQNYEGLEVRTTVLSLLFSPDGLFSMSGHWYNNIYIPKEDNYTEEKAKALLLGKTLNYSSSKLVIDEDVFWHNSQKVILPKRVSDDDDATKQQIELRVCWALFPETWEVLVDTQTGEVLSKVDIDAI